MSLAQQPPAAAPVDTPRARRRASRASSHRYSPRATAVLIAPLMLILGAAFIYPIGRFLLEGIFDPGLTGRHYERALTEPVYLRVLLRTIRVAVIVTVLSLVLGYPVAYLLSRVGGWKATLIAACVFIPLWTSVLVRSYAWVIVLQRNGVVNETLEGAGVIGEPMELLYREGSVVVAMTQILMPFLILPLYSTLRGIPEDLPRAAQSLGASPLAAFRHVILPLSLPGVVAGCVLVFVLALGFFITPALVGGPRNLMVSTLISQQVSETLNFPFAAALAGVLLVVTMLILVAFNRSVGIDRMVDAR